MAPGGLLIGNPQEGTNRGSSPPRKTLPLEELARSRRIDLLSLRVPQDSLQGYQGPKPRFEVDIKADIEYGAVGGESLRLDLYLPRNDFRNRAAVVLFHGGGWRDRMGSRYSTASQAKWFASRGLVAASVEYRLAPRHQWPAQLEDCQLSIRWLRGNARLYSIDPSKIASTGGSAGGHLAAMVALTDSSVDPREPFSGFSSQVNLALPNSVPVDFLNQEGAGTMGDDICLDVFGYPLRKVPAEIKRSFSLLEKVTSDDPPFFITHSRNDRLIPTQLPETLFAKLKSVGVLVELDLIDGQGGGHAMNMSAAEYSRHDNRLWDFIRRAFDLE